MLFENKQDFEAWKLFYAFLLDKRAQELEMSWPTKYPCFLKHINYFQEEGELAMEFIYDFRELFAFRKKSLVELIEGQQKLFDEICKAFREPPRGLLGLVNYGEDFDFTGYESYDYFAIDNNGDGYVYVEEPYLSYYHWREESVGGKYVGKFDNHNWHRSLKARNETIL